MVDNFDKILENCKRKDKQAQIALFRLFCKDVYNSSFRILKDSCQAEEVTQDTFLKFFEKVTKVERSVAAVRAFLKRIAINQSIDIYRRRNAVSFISVDDAGGDVPDFDDKSDIDTHISVAKIKEELNNMPDGYRLVLTLRLIEDMSFDDIASQLAITPSTVRSQYVRGREKLKENLMKER